MTHQERQSCYLVPVFRRAILYVIMGDILCLPPILWLLYTGRISAVTAKLTAIPLALLFAVPLLLACYRAQRNMADSTRVLTEETRLMWDALGVSLETPGQHLRVGWPDLKVWKRSGAVILELPDGRRTGLFERSVPKEARLDFLRRMDESTSGKGGPVVC